MHCAIRGLLVYHSITTSLFSTQTAMKPFTNLKQISHKKDKIMSPKMHQIAAIFAVSTLSASNICQCLRENEQINTSNTLLSFSNYSNSTKKRVRAGRGWSPIEGWLLVPQWSEPTPWTRPQMPPGPKTPVPIQLLKKDLVLNWDSCT